MRLSSPLPLFFCFFMRQIKSSTSSSIAFLMTTTVTPSSSTHSLRVSLKDSQKNSAPMRPVRIVSYNVLSSKLSRPSHFTHANPDHLTMEYRLPLILQRLEREMDRSPIGSENKADDEPTERSLPPPPTIFTLQEICYPFTSELHAFFAQRGYQFITGLYGKKFNGYMGVGIAYPTEHFETVKVDICRLSDERIDGWPKEEEINESVAPKIGLIQHFSKVFHDFIRNRLVKQLGWYNQQEQQQKPIDPWEMSENRYNVLISVALRHRHKAASSTSSSSAGTFLISNYHMPCAFFAPPVMNIHAEMVARRVQTLASNLYDNLHEDKETPDGQQGEITTIPYILAGDFNVMPDSPHYKLLTTGCLDKLDQTFPPPKFGVDWAVQSEAMDSAYAAIGKEPEFTNYAHIQDNVDPFIGTLDYIFLSRKETTSTCSSDGIDAGEWWKVNGVMKLPTLAESGGPFPNAVEPSDHLLISADLELISK